MIIIENTIISDEVVTTNFCCDLPKCFGKCCIEGDAGAPLEEEEIHLLEKYFEEYRSFLTPEGLAIIEQDGFFSIDQDNDLLTPLMKNATCAYANIENGIFQCAIEKAFNIGLIPFKKPISCHLYPIRLKQLKFDIAINYHHWQICKDALTNGDEKKIPLYQFLKEPLIRKFGKEWYDVLCESARQLS